MANAEYPCGAEGILKARFTETFPMLPSDLI